MKKNILVKSIKENINDFIFKIERIGPKRVSLEIIKPIPDKDGFVTKFFKSGNYESISYFKKRNMTRDYFNKFFKIINE